MLANAFLSMIGFVCVIFLPQFLSILDNDFNPAIVRKVSGVMSVLLFVVVVAIQAYLP